MRPRLTILILVSALLIGLSLAGPAVAQVPPARNNAVGTLASGIDSTTTTIVLTAGQGAKFPTTAEGDWFGALYNSTDYSAPHLDPNFEVVKVTARSTDTLTVVRGQDGTTAVSHNTVGKTYTFFNGWFKISIDRTRDAITGVSGTIPNVVDCAGACATAVSGIGSNVRTLRVSGTEPVASNLSIGETITVWPIGAGTFNISGSVTLTLHSPTQVWAAPHQQIFTGAGTVAFTKPGTVYPKWWGAKCDGSTDDGPEFQAALDSLPAAGGTLEVITGTCKLNQELLVNTSDVTIRLGAGAALDIATIGGTGTANVHDTANVLAAIRIAPSATRVRIVGGRITGTATVSGKKTIGILIAGATQTKVGGVKIDGLHAGIWPGGNAVEPTIQNVELASNEYGLVSGYRPTTSSNPQVSRMTLINNVIRNSTVGAGIELTSYTDDTTIIGGRIYSNAGCGINGAVGGASTKVSGVDASSNTGAGLCVTYTANSGTISGKLGFAKKWTIVGNTFKGNGGDGVTIHLPDYSLFSTIGGIEDVLLEGNLSDGNTGYGYQLGLVRSVVRGNRALGNTLDGFNIRSNQATEYSGNQSWDNGTSGSNRTGYLFTTAATTGSTPPKSTGITFTNNHGGDTRSGGSRTTNFTFNLAQLDSGNVTDNIGKNANTADWQNTNSGSAVSFVNNRGTVSGSDVIGVASGKFLHGSATWNPPSLVSGDQAETTVTVTGAAVGDLCLAGHSTITSSLMVMSCIISATDTARVVINNRSGSTVDPASGTVTVRAWKP